MTLAAEFGPWRFLARCRDHTLLPEVMRELSMPLISEDEVATTLGVSIRKLQRMRTDGEGPAYVKIGRHVRYDTAAIDIFLRTCTRYSTADADTERKVSEAAR